ncbi:MAG: patatin-like phospholipase family protein, partial [Acidobacteriota bacterium]|nr:patatin-like phospholipase family protein [Acidobacteriota bacterium]
KVGLALGGGAARGIAHVGVIRGLVRAGIPIDIVSGTSMGAIIGGAYAATEEIDVLVERVREVLSSAEFQKNRLSFLRETKRSRGGLFFSVANLVRKGIFFGVSNIRASFLSAEEFATSMAAILPDTDIDKLPLPFGAVSLDIKRAEEIVHRSGNLRRAAAASSAIPGILPPVKINGRVLIDGGWIDKVPVLPAFTMGADVVIAVDINADLVESKNYRKGVDIMFRANSIKDATLVSLQCGMADVVVRPAVSHIHWADFTAWERCIEAGERAAEEAVPAIRDLLRQERLFSIVRSGTGKRLSELVERSGARHLVLE